MFSILDSLCLRPCSGTNELHRPNSAAHFFRFTLESVTVLNIAAVYRPGNPRKRCRVAMPTSRCCHDNLVAMATGHRHLLYACTRLTESQIRGLIYELFINMGRHRSRSSSRALKQNIITFSVQRLAMTS